MAKSLPVYHTFAEKTPEPYRAIIAVDNTFLLAFIVMNISPDGEPASLVYYDGYHNLDKPIFVEPKLLDVLYYWTDVPLLDR